MGIQLIGVIVLRDPEYETAGRRGSQSRRDRVSAVDQLQSAGCRERARVVQDGQSVRLTLRRGDFGEWRVNWCSHADDSERAFQNLLLLRLLARRASFEVALFWISAPTG